MSEKDNGAVSNEHAVRNFDEGDVVVYPNHGAGSVAAVEEKTVLGEARRYYVIYIQDTGLTLSIPADGATGLRYCADEAGVAGALTVLEGGPAAMPPNWNHRLKHNQKKLREGSIDQVAEVVRDLNAYSNDHGLSTGERNMLMKARQILVSEIALANETELSEAEFLVNGALEGGGEET